MIDDVFRDRLTALAAIDRAQAAHQEQVIRLAQERRAIVVEMVDLARNMGQRAPQAFVAARMGIAQQTVSKIINGK